METSGHQTLRKSVIYVNSEDGDDMVGRLTREGRIDLLKSLIDLLADLGAGKNNFATDEDE